MFNASSVVLCAEGYQMSSCSKLLAWNPPGTHWSMPSMKNELMLLTACATMREGTKCLKHYDGIMHQSVCFPFWTGYKGASRSQSRWIWWRGSWAGHGRRSVAPRIMHWAWCICVASSPSSVILHGTWPRKNKKKNFTWCCRCLTG